MSRWGGNKPADNARWDHRAERAADWLREARSVADIGCGSMRLEHFLSPEQRYEPVDLVARDSRTIVLDLNKPADLARLPEADAAALLGVIEYSYDLPVLLLAVRVKYKRAAVSYQVAIDGRTDAREGQGWQVHLGLDGIREAFRSAGFTIVRELNLKAPQVLFDLS